MRRFTELFIRLDRTTRTSEKLAALRDYFRTAPPADAVWAVYLMTGRRIGRTVSFRLLRDWVAEVSGYPQWLVDECYTLVGDLSETLSLLLAGKSDGSLAPPLHELIEATLKPLGSMSIPQQREAIVETWDKLNGPQTLVFHKLLSREFRIGVSRQLVVRALAEAAGVDSQVMAHRLAGNWTPDEATMRTLLSAESQDAEVKRQGTMPYPFMLAQPLGEPAATLGDIADWMLEWKWDGIRAQIVRREGQTAIWSRGDELVTSAFPDLVQAASLPEGTVLDGEIVAFDEAAARPMPFAKLQPRINRKNVEMSFWPDVPVAYIAFDLLEIDGRDIRAESLETRRAQLEELIAKFPPGSIVRLSSLVNCASWEDAEQFLTESRQRAVEGLMIKRRTSPYQAGRPTGLWWKLKIQPYTVDCVLIAAQSGHGRRAGLLTDYTFGVWADGGDELVPVAKAYSGLTDKEIAEVDRWVRRHTIERYGPVHVVQPVRVFELGFEAIQASDRHKSGIAVRFPRMLRERTDKKPKDADTLQSLRQLLAQTEARS
jgi:DNA ligase-1